MDVPETFYIGVLNPGFNKIASFNSLDGWIRHVLLDMYIRSGDDFSATLYATERDSVPTQGFLSESETRNISYDSDTYLRISFNEISRFFVSSVGYSFWLYIDGSINLSGYVFDSFDQFNDGINQYNAKLRFLEVE